MANSSMPVAKVAGLALIVVGIGLIVWGYQLSGSVTAELTQTVSGSLPDEVMVRYIGGAVSLIVGLFLTFRR